MKLPARLGRLFTLEDRAAPTTDPLFGQQWHLGNIGQSGGAFGEDLVVQPAWDPDGGNVTGFGVLVGVVGDGLQISHPDLAPNYVALHARDFIDGDTDPIPNLPNGDGEGTALAGLVASAADNSNGSFTYTADANFHGTDPFTYTASAGGLDSAPGTVTITVLSVNDAPDAVNDVAATPAGKPVTIPVLANDTDVDADPLQVASLTAPARGRVTRSGTGLKYTPSAGYQGPDSFTYTVLDGHGGSDTATVTVNVTDTTRPTLPAVRVGFGTSSRDLKTISRGVLPWSGVRRFEFVFSEAVAVNPSALTLTGPTGNVPLTFTAPGANRTAVWTVTGPDLPTGRYSLRLGATLVSDLNGNLLARDYTRSFGLLVGDFDGSGRVTATDVASIRKNFQSDPTKTNRYADINGDGVVNQADADLATANLNKTL